jgi:hypothetical protein
MVVEKRAAAYHARPFVVCGPRQGRRKCGSVAAAFQENEQAGTAFCREPSPRASRSLEMDPLGNGATLTAVEEQS